MDGKKCFFIGHREAPDELMERLKQAVWEHIYACGVKQFIVGHYGGFDRMATRAVTEAKQAYPQVQLFMLQPYHPFRQRIELPPGFDGTLYPEGMENVPYKLAIPRANRYMVDHADYLIAWAQPGAGNAGKLVRYAQGREKQGLIQVCNLAV